MAKKRKTYERYREAKTGRFASRVAARKSIARGFHRFKRERAHIFYRVPGKHRAPVGVSRGPAQGFPAIDVGAGAGTAGPSVGGPQETAPAGKDIESLQEFYDYEDFDYDVAEFDTGIDYGEAS